MFGETAWRRYFFMVLPLAALFVIATCEIVAFGLSDQRRLRHPGEYLLADISKNSYNADIALLGDSVTKNISDKYALAEPARVVNLTDNISMGIVGVYFVLRRYLLKNRAPEAVLIVGTPEYLRYVPEGFLGHYYLASTFREDFEVDWLRENAPSLVPVFWKPAIFSIYDDVIAPLSGIIRSANRKSIFGDEPVHSFDATVLLAAHNEPSAIVENFVTRGKNDLSLEEGTAQEAWASLCELLNRHGIDLHVAIAPAPATSVAAWRLGGQIRSLAHAISNVDGSVCSKAIHHDFNTPILYADVLFSDSDHLRKSDATAYYADKLSTLIGQILEIGKNPT